MISKLIEAIEFLVPRTPADQGINSTTEGPSSQSRLVTITELLSPRRSRMDDLSDEVLVCAIQNRMATNPILRVAATALINELKK